MATYNVPNPTGVAATDTANIQAALNSAKDNPGSTVILGSGTYMINNKLRIGSNTEFKGFGASVSKIKVANYAIGTNYTNCVFGPGVPVIGVSSGYATNISIHDFEFDGNCKYQSSTLGDPTFSYHGNNKSWGNSVEVVILFAGSSGGSYVRNISIYNMHFHDCFSEALICRYGQNIKFYNNECENMMHNAVYYTACNGSGNEIHHNTIEAITDGGIRCDSCQNVDIYNNTITPYNGPNNVLADGTVVPKNGANGMQIANNGAKNSAGSFVYPKTDNIDIHNNTLTDIDLCGIWLNDQIGTAGTTAQKVHIYNNEFVNCGKTGNPGVDYCGCIAFRPWGNGVHIEYNTINGSHPTGISILSVIDENSTKTIQINNNNIINTQGKGTSGSSVDSKAVGYAIYNKISSKVTAAITGNYFNGNLSGSVYPTTLTHTDATSPITITLPGSGTTDDDPIEDPTDDAGGTIYIPPVIGIIDDNESDYFERTPYAAYINGVEFEWQKFNGSGGKVIGESKSPSLAGWNLSDMDSEGAIIEFDCLASSIDELKKVQASFYRRGRSTIELGGPYDGYRIKGIGKNHSAEIPMTEGVPAANYPYKFTFLSEKPYMEKIQKKVRGRYIYNSMQFSSDDYYSGNIVKNPSFEDWTTNSALDWGTQTSASDNEWRCVRYSPELGQFCAVAASGTDNTKVMISSDGKSWTIPLGLTNATNCNNQWRGLVWAPEISKWIATSITGTGNRCMVSSDGVTWTAKTTPADNSWGYVLWVPPNDSVPNGRLVAIAYGGTNRIMYSDNSGDSWTAIASPIETNNWLSAAYSPKLGRIVAVAYTGSTTQQVMTSDNYGTTWTARTTPSYQKWTSVIWADTLELFVAVSEDDAHATTSPTTQQVMTSPDGITWTLRDTPYSSSSTSGGGTVVTTLGEDTPTGYNYTTLATTYDTAVNPMYTFTLPALSGGHIYRLDNIHAQLRATSAGPTASMEVRYKIGTGPETVLATWTEMSTTYQPKSLSLATEINATSDVTISFYLKSSSSSIRAGATLMGYDATELTASGSSITYARNQWRALTWAKELGLIVAVSQTGTGNRVMNTTNGIDWHLGESAADNNWVSIAYAAPINKFVAVGTSGTGNRVMLLENYGTLKNVAPVSWVFESAGQSRSDLTTIDGVYSLLIEGDGATEEPGKISQKLPFDSTYDAGVRYILSARGKVEGLTSGSFRVDICDGTLVIKELVWNADTDWTQKQIYFKFDAIPSSVLIRVHGSETPNNGAMFYCDDIVVSRASDFEIASSGSAIITSGNCNVIPKVVVKGVSTTTASPSTGRVVPITSDPNITFTSQAIEFSSDTSSLEYTLELQPLTNGSKYRIDELSCQLKSGESHTSANCKITVQAASLWNGQETDIAMWGTQSTDYIQETYTLPYLLQSDTNETVTIRYYLKTSNSSYRAAAKLFGCKYTEILDSTGVVSNSLSLYNTADPRKVLKCCNSLPAGYMVEIKNDWTGALRYTEDFSDSSYASIAHDITGNIAYNSANRTISMNAGSSITFVFDCLYPVTGTPFIKLFVVSGVPQISISEDGTNFYPVDGNTSVNLDNAEMTRALNNETNLKLRGKTKYYVKIAPYGSGACEFGQLLEYATLDTTDAERFYIYATGEANTIAAIVGDDGTGKCSMIVSLEYNDADILP